MSILVGSVECNGSESGLLECAHVTGSDEAVTQCDLRESAAVACQGKEMTHVKAHYFRLYNFYCFLIDHYFNIHVKLCLLWQSHSEFLLLIHQNETIWSIFQSFFSSLLY